MAMNRRQTHLLIEPVFFFQKYHGVEYSDDKVDRVQGQVDELKGIMVRNIGQYHQIEVKCIHNHLNRFTASQLIYYIINSYLLVNRKK